MTPVQAIAQLDRQIARHGQTVTLARLVPSQPEVTLECRAFVRGYKPDELANGVQQGDSEVVISPTALVGTAFDAPNLPSANNKVVVSGRRRNIQMPEPVMLDDVLVRLNLQVRG